MWANRFSIAVWEANSVRFDPERLHRRSIRLKGYDYSQPGAYFITICTQDRACLFGEVVDGEMRLNDAGQMVQDEIGQPQGVAPTKLSLPDVVHRFKTMTTKRYIDGVKKFGWTPFRRRLWQRNYYEHIIRNDHALQRIREYIWTNPLRWHLDRENPNRSRFGRI
jgi:REP element-mobilizing transposase RayT